MSSYDLNIIVAVDNQGGFARGKEIPWHFKKDFKHFQDITTGHVCVMGRNTYDEILQKMESKKKNVDTQGILPKRTSYVITSRPDDVRGAIAVTEFNAVLQKHPKDKIFVLGGERLFMQTWSYDPTVYMTVIDHNYDCDQFFMVGTLNKRYQIAEGKKDSEKGTTLYFVTYKPNKR